MLGWVPSSDEFAPCAQSALRPETSGAPGDPEPLPVSRGLPVFREVFFHASWICGSLFGCRVSGATLRQPCRANRRYTTEAATGRPNFCANAARSGETTRIPPSLEACTQGARKRSSSSSSSEARRRPPQFGRIASGLANSRRRRACSLGTVARPMPSTAALCSSVAPNSAGSSTACAQRRASTLSASLTAAWACVTNSGSTRRGLAMSMPPKYLVLRNILALVSS